MTEKSKLYSKYQNLVLTIKGNNNLKVIICIKNYFFKILF